MVRFRVTRHLLDVTNLTTGCVIPGRGREPANPESTFHHDEGFRVRHAGKFTQPWLRAATSE
jgi:hypothetical protein